MTGRAAGPCAGYPNPGFMAPGGRGRGRGWRNQYRATGLTGWQRAAMDGAVPPMDIAEAQANVVAPPPQADAGQPPVEDLKAEIQQMGNVLQAILKRIEDLETPQE